MTIELLKIYSLLVFYGLMSVFSDSKTCEFDHILSKNIMNNARHGTKIIHFGDKRVRGILMTSVSLKSSPQP